jgi:hypothetical protein
MNTVAKPYRNSFRKCIGEYREWQEDWLFIWVSGNRLFDARLKAEVIMLWMICMEELRLFTKYIKIQVYYSIL